MISYEWSMGLALIAVVMMSGTLSLREMVEQQQE
jgi:NADH:ubiquinone oxidoreductase subunit H